MKIINITLSKYKRTEAICRFLKPFSEPGRPSSIKSRILFIRGVKKYVLNKKLIAIAIPNIIPETKSPNEKDRNINIEIKKQKLKRRGNMYLKNFLEWSSSSVLKTAGEVTTMKEVIAPRIRAFNSNPISTYIAII
tara:strand:- start:835 stop:1242 length:408 start_codon:yes stop_codon:yes gene_type:complete